MIVSLVLSLMALDSFLGLSVESELQFNASTSLMFCDQDRPDHTSRLRPCQVDRKQSVSQVGLLDLHAVRQHERALELPGSDAPVHVLTTFVVLLAAPDHKLFLLDGHLKLLKSKSRDG